MNSVAEKASEQVGLTVVDRWLAWPSIASLTFTTTFYTICGLPGGVGFGATPFVFLVYCCFAIATLIMIIRSAVTKMPRKLISFCGVFLIPFIFSSAISWVADCVHLELFLGSQNGHVSQKARNELNGFIAYDWANGLAGDPAEFLLYDSTDEISLSGALENRPASFDDGFWGHCSGRVDHLFGHYYTCRF